MISMGLRGGVAIETSSVPLKKPLLTALCQRRLAPHRCGRPGSILGNWADACGFLKLPESDQHWKVRLPGAFSNPHEALCLRPTDQSCHHEAWLHLDFVEWHDVQPQREKHDQRILLKELPAPYHFSQQKRRISDIMSDHSLSS